MHIFNLINTWSQFIPHIIINDIAPFNELIQLAQTCKKLNQYFHEIKAYSLLCQYNLRKTNMIIFTKPEKLYINQYEKQLFQKIYKYQKNKMTIKISHLAQILTS